MAFSVVWFAVQGKPAEHVLEDAGLVDTGEPDEVFDAEVSGAEYPGGWYVVLGSDPDMLEAANLVEWSEDARLVAVVCHEETRFSLATEWRDGAAVWSISHEAGEGEAQIAVEGALPEAFEAVRAGFLMLADGRSEARKAFEVPVEVAFQITGFRHDAVGFEENGPVFMRLEEE